jgi:hypothetical protein
VCLNSRTSADIHPDSRMVFAAFVAAAAASGYNRPAFNVLIGAI